MTEKRHHSREHSKVTTTPPACGSLCTGVKRQEKSDYIKDEHDGGRPNALVRREHYGAVRWGSGRVLGGREQAVVVRQLQHNPHKVQLTKDERHLVQESPRHFNGSPSPKSSRPSALKKSSILANYNNPSTPKDALLPYLVHNLLFARFLGSFTNTKYRSESKKTGNMDLTVSTHRSHRISGEDELSRRSRHHRRQHRHSRNGHKSDGELEKDRLRAKIRGGEKESSPAHMERCSSDHGKMKDRVPERSRRAETDEEREERRRKRKERKEAEARPDLDLLLPDGRGHRLHRREGEKKASPKEVRHESDNEGNLSSRSNKDKQIILVRKEKDSSKSSSRHVSSPHESSSSRKAESKQRRQKHGRCNDNSNSSEETAKEGSGDKTRNILGFLLEKKDKDKDKMVTCVSCLSDDLPCHQAAKLACNHYFCRGCLKRIFHLSLTDPAHMPPRCCSADHIPLKFVEKLLSFQTKRLWNKKYTEYTTSNRIYCPSKDCGEWIPPRDIVGKIGKCSRCKTKVCTMCNGKAHGSSDCPQDEDLKAFVKVVKANGYQKCYSCRAVVELDRGCNHITCRCTAEFCYLCGDKWKTCKCPWFAYPDSAEEDDHEDPVAENENTIQERRRRDQREEREAREMRERRARESQMAQDEALARRLANIFLDEETVEKVDDSGTLRTGLRNSYKKLAEEYAEASRRDEEAREERVKDRLQKLRDRDEAIRSARRGSSFSHRESRPGTARHERRHSEPRPSTSRGTHSRPQTAQTPSSPLIRESHERGGTSQHRIFDEQAARIAKYIMGELDNLDDELPHQSSASTENSAGLSSPQQRPRTERTRRATTSAMSPKPSTRKSSVESRPSYSHYSGKEATSGVLPYELGTPTYASSSVLADVAFPLDHEKPNRRSSSHTRTHKIKETYANSNAKSAPTSPLRPTCTNPPKASTSHKGNLADLGFKFLKQQQNAELYPTYPLGYVSAPTTAPTHTSYAYSSYTGFGAAPGENNMARQFVQNWGGMEGMSSTLKEPFVDRFELATHNPRIGVTRTTTY